MALLSHLRLDSLSKAVLEQQYILHGLWLLPILYIAGRCVYLIYFHPLSNVPGPALAKLTNLWQGYYAARLLKASKIHGMMDLSFWPSLHICSGTNFTYRGASQIRGCRTHWLQ